MGHGNCGACAPCGRVRIMLPYGSEDARVPCGRVRIMFLAGPQMILYIIMCPNRTDCSFPLASTVGWDVWTRVLILDFLVDLYNSIYIVTSVLTQRELDHHYAVFNIPVELRPELPDWNAIIKDSLEGKIGMYTRFIEFANFWMPLSKFLLYILEYYQINLSQLFVIGTAKVSHFEIMCRVLGRVPTVGTFRRLYVNSISNGWLSFSKRGGVDDPCCYSNKFDSLKSWNNHFSGLTLRFARYPLHGLVALLLSKIRLRWTSRSFTETEVRPTLLHNNDDGRCLVKTGERTLAENEVPLMTETEDRVISPFSQTISLVDHTIQDELNVNVGKRKKRVAFVSGSSPVKKAWTEGVIISDSRPSTAGKSPTALWRLIRQSGQAATGSGSAAPATKDATSSSVTPTLEHASEGDNVRTCPPSGYFVVLSSGSTDTDIPTSPQPASDGRTSSAPELEAGTLSTTPSQGSTADDFYESQTIDSTTALNVYVPNWNITNNARIDNHVTCRNLLEHVTPPGYWAALRNQHDAEFLDSFILTRLSMFRLRYEHEIIMRGKYEKNFIDSAAVVQQKDAKIIDLRAWLEKSEAEAADVTELRKRVSDLEAMVAVKVGDVATLNIQNAGLSKKVSALELVRGELDSKVAQLTADCDGLRDQVVGEERAAALDARIADVRRDMDNDLYPHMLTAIAGRSWVVGHGICLAVHKCAIEAYDPEIEVKYVAAVSEFKGVSFPLLDELESLKDSPLSLIMSALTLKDDHGNTDATPEFCRFQPSLDQVTVPIYFESDSIDCEMLLSDVIPTIRQSAERRGLCPPSSSTLCGTSSSAPPHDSSLGVADYQVSTLVLSGDGGPANQPPVIQPHDDLFDVSVLDKSGDA
ncbi:hypothetical protein Tco_0756433 [Tanacetum coccineum]